jgi:6-pyruvoyltetrahydropterin/6-carboxytetrahydropterin synthase
MIIAKIFSFDAAHVLPDHPGKCSRLHGHTYKLEVLLDAPVAANGMVFDFFELKKIVNEKILDRLDHQFLNDIIAQSTAENIAIWIWNELKDEVPLYQIKLWETPTSYVIYSGH